MPFNALRGLFGTNVKRSPARVGARRFRPTFDLLEARRMLSATLWVDPSSSNPHDFTTIQAAVNAAHNGDTIKVAAGFEYDESVVVGKTLTILGGQKHTTAQSGASVVKSDSVAFTLDADRISLQGFNIQPLTAAAVGIATDPGHSGYTILNNVISQELDGLDFNTTTNSWTLPSTVRGNRFISNTDGIVSELGLRNATISTNIFNNNDSSVDVTGTAQSKNVQIVNNQILNGPTMAPNALGVSAPAEPFVVSLIDPQAEICLANVTNSAVDGNTINDPHGIGILLGGGVTYSEVAHNVIQTVQRPTGNGIELNSVCVIQANTNDTVSWNTVTSAAVGRDFDNGIILFGGSKNTVSKNTVKLARENGIALADGATRTTVSGNTATQNGINGILLDSSDNNCVSGNNANQNTNDGIALSNSNQNSVSCNTANYNLVDGIGLDNSSHNTISGNNTNHNTDDGVNLVNSGWNTVCSNTANYNTANGIALNQANSVNNTVSSNTTKFNTGDGIALLNQANSNTVSGNTASNNGGDGIELIDASNNTISGNTFRNNTGAGIFVHSGSTGNTIRRNTALGNVFFDLFDASAGSGTAGTANTWSQNTASTRSPANLH